MVPVPPADWSSPAGRQYAEWLAAVRELDPSIAPDDHEGEPPIPLDGYSFCDNAFHQKQAVQ